MANPVPLHLNKLSRGLLREVETINERLVMAVQEPASASNIDEYTKTFHAIWEDGLSHCIQMVDGTIGLTPDEREALLASLHTAATDAKRQLIGVLQEAVGQDDRGVKFAVIDGTPKDGGEK